MGWKGSFLGKDKQKVWNVGSLCIFWMVWKARNDIAFRDKVLSIQRLKSLFVHLFSLLTKVFFVDGPMTFVHFIDCVGS